jgi:hypothetical protein
VSAPTDFATGIAKVVSIKGRFAVVACPFCACRHAHSLASIGSAEVIAGCHTPHRPRTYAIRKPNKGNR